jgi:hypothetical protein
MLNCDVVLVRRIFSSGKPRGVGNLEWGRDGKGEVSLRVTWGQGGRDRITPRRVSKRGVGLKQQGVGKGIKRQGDCAIIM